jgi:hypothetical protein
MEFLFDLIAQIILRIVVVFTRLSTAKFAGLSFVSFMLLGFVFQLFFSQDVSLISVFVFGVIGTSVLLCLRLLAKRSTKKL